MLIYRHGCCRTRPGPGAEKGRRAAGLLPPGLAVFPHFFHHRRLPHRRPGGGTGGAAFCPALGDQPPAGPDPWLPGPGRGGARRSLEGRLCSERSRDREAEWFAEPAVLLGARNRFLARLAGTPPPP